MWRDRPHMNMLKSRLEAILLDGRSRETDLAERATVLIQLAVETLQAEDAKSDAEAATRRCHQLVDEVREHRS
jgi:hypothetical protein